MKTRFLLSVAVGLSLLSIASAPANARSERHDPVGH